MTALRGPGGSNAARPTRLAARLGNPESGSTATEYAILAGFIAVVIAVALSTFGSSLSEYFHYITNAVGSAL